MTWIVPLAAGIVLAAATGLRAFLPLAVIAWAGRLGWLPLNDSFHWIGSLPAVIAFSSAVALELLADKYPALDHVFDVLNTVIKPVAATVIVAASFTELDPLYALVIGVAAGASIAEVVHLVKAKLRLVANLFSFGLAAPVLSLVEDAVTLGLTCAALLVPLLAVIAVAGLVAVLLWRRRAART